MDANLRISQQSLEMNEIISELNSKERYKSAYHHDDEFAPSPRESPWDDTFRHYDDHDLNYQRASWETLTRQLSPRDWYLDKEPEQPAGYKSAMPQEPRKEFVIQHNGPYHHPQIIDEDVETFKMKLEATILNFKNDAMKDFMGIKRNILQEQSNTIGNERNKYNALLSSKQNEIENLKEQLANANKLNEGLQNKWEKLGFSAGVYKELTRLRVTQYKAFLALKSYAGFKKHAKNVLNAKNRENKLKMKRMVFQGWGKHWKEWKIKKSKEDFEFKLKEEMSIISAQYSKEIDTLRRQLNELRETNEAYERTKIMMQENLKKAFMKGVWAMNMEAMSILHPSEQLNIERKFESLAEWVFSESTPVRQLAFNNSRSSEWRAYDSNLKDEIFKKFGMQMSDANESDQSSKSDSVQQTPVDKQKVEENPYPDEKDIKVERNAYTELDTASMSKQLFKNSSVKITRPGDDIVIWNSKIESKDNAWKPAPALNIEPQIVNNMNNKSLYTNKNSNFSYSQNMSVPKHTLGINPPQNQVLSNEISNSTLNYIHNFQFVPQEKSKNSDLYGVLESQSNSNLFDINSSSHFGKYDQESYDPSSEIKTIKENMSTNIIDSIPNSNLPSILNKSTTSLGGKTIRINK